MVILVTTYPTNLQQYRNPGSHTSRALGRFLCTISNNTGAWRDPYRFCWRIFSSTQRSTLTVSIS